MDLFHMELKHIRFFYSFNTLWLNGAEDLVGFLLYLHQGYGKRAHMTLTEGQ